MNGPTLTMAPPALGLDDSSAMTATPSTSAFEVPSFDFSHSFDTTLFLDGKDAALAVMEKEPPVVMTRPARGRRQAEEAAEKEKNSSKRYSLVERPKSWLVNSKSATNIRDFLADRPSVDIWDKENNDPDKDTEGTKGLTESNSGSSFASFRRKSWISLSLPSSPQHDFQHHQQQQQSQQDAGPAPNKLRKVAGGDAATKGLASTRKRSMSALELSTMAAGAPRGGPHATATEDFSPASTNNNRERSQTMTTKASEYFATKLRPKQQQQQQQHNSVFSKLANDSDTSRSSSATSLALPGTTTFTVEHQGNFKTQSFADSSATSLDSEDMAPQRDPLWNIFKNLELEGKRLFDLGTPQRVHLVRTHLMTFLRASASQSTSTRSLHPDDLDRRASILDVWWRTLIEMIDGQNGQPLAGTERPVVLEAATLVMERPEWRQATTCFLPLSERSPTERVRSFKSSSGSTSSISASSSSLSSDQADFLRDSAEHNVRNMFVANLTAQMSLVIGKLSMNHAPLSLVSFCAKACAYAFFFAPGVSDVLVRLWNLGPDYVTRAADELGLPRRDGGESEDMIALFPPNLAAVGWSSAKDISARLRIVPRLPMAVARIQWYFGRWLARWRGLETDLFYIFTKYYFILAEEFMPPGLPLVEKARSPAFVLVQAQMLTVLEVNIRQPALSGWAGAGASGPSLYDSAYGPDAAAMAPGMARAGLARAAPENLLMVLVKNFLGDTTYRSRPARHTFAESFQTVLRACVKRTSLFAANTCHALCDVLEEVLCAYGQYDDIDDNDEEGRPGSAYIDWDVMLDAARKMSGSLNVNTDIRLLSFVYMAWDTITADRQRKEALVLGWLLTEEVFDKYFNNWSPMVRAYFMRLLCWRICWDLGRANELDTKIFMTVAARLKTNWSHYTYLKQTAEKTGRMLPTTAACPPAPGKIFAIRPVELNTPQPGLFTNFDALNRPPLLANNPEPAVDTSPSKTSNNKKRWSLLGKVLTLSNTVGPESPKLSSEDALDEARRETASARTRPSSAAPPPPPPKPSPSRAASDDASSTGSAPVYADPQRIWRFELENFFYPPVHARERPIARPRLPAPAQARVTARSRSGSTPPPPAARMPAPTRRVSGLKEGGLISGARNASSEGAGGRGSPVFPSSPTSSRVSTETAPQLSFSPSFVRTLSEPLDGISPSESEGSIMTRSSGGSGGSSVTADAVRPAGAWAVNARYAGRALAEWSFVVAECNGFVDQMRKEGVLGLAEMEVPRLVTQGPPPARG